MTKDKIISIVEHERIKISDDNKDKTITQDQCNAIFALQDDANCIAFTPVRTGIKANQYVGVFSVAGVNVEILPKIANIADNENHKQQRRRIVEIIAYANDIDAKTDQSFATIDDDNNLLEALINLFAIKVSEYIKRGVVRDYVNISDDISKFRGKLIIQRQFTKFAATPNILACNFDEYSADTNFNRLIYCAMQKLFRLTNSDKNRRLLGENLERFGGVSLIDAKALLKVKIKETRQLKPWKQIEELARLILKNTYQTISSGKSVGFCLLFDMNRIFEQYIAKIAQKINANVKTQFSEQYLCEGRRFNLKPDLFVEGGETLIIDTKWKLPGNKVANADMYQMFAYTEIYKAEKAILLYPKPYKSNHEHEEDIEGETIEIKNIKSNSIKFKVKDKETIIATHFIDISEHDKACIYMKTEILN